MVPGWVAWPQYSGAALAGVLSAACAACGRPVDELGPASLRRLGAPAADAVCVVLADGLGAEQLAERSGHAPFLRGQTMAKLRTGFPSTTVASLGSLGTGLAPSQTGLAGYTLRDPWTGQRATLIAWDTPTDPLHWQPHPTIFEKLAALGQAPTMIGQAKFENSALTASSLRGATFIAAASPARRVEAAIGALRRGGLVYLYWGELDKAGHPYGWRSRQWGEALEVFDAALRQLTSRLPANTSLWVTADHGMIDIDLTQRWDISSLPALREGVELVAGEPRAVHLYTADADAVAERWRQVLGERAWIVTQAEAVATGLFGPADDRTSAMLGDVIVAMAGRATVVDSRFQTPAALKLIGQHGSLTSAEMDVPFIVL